MPRARTGDENEGTANTRSPWRTPREGTDKGPGSLDLIIGLGLVVAALMAVILLPEGSWLRLALTLPMLFFVPGYLLIQATVGAASTTRWRIGQGLLAVGMSPGIVGILALATSLVPGAFKSGIIIGVVTTATVLFGMAAFYRRSLFKGMGTPARAANHSPYAPMSEDIDGSP